jgi:hypothetical protein
MNLLVKGARESHGFRGR